MKSHLFLSALALLLATANLTSAARTAQARIWCSSLLFHQGESNDGSTLDFTTIQNGINGEMRPSSTNADYYASGFILDYIGLPVSGLLSVKLPPFADANNDGFDDFLESPQEVSGTTASKYQTALGGGRLSTTWSRAAGSKDGTCSMHLIDDQYGDLGSFHFVFELLEYSGPLTYTPGASNVSGRVDLVQTGIPDNYLSGPVSLDKDASDPANLLDVRPTIWTNAAAQEFSWPTYKVQRDYMWPTNYYGYFDFEDGNPNTAEVDYPYWTISIDDMNDADKNGIPDFGDVPSGKPTSLSISYSGTNLTVSISGEIGKTCTLQQTSSLQATDWQDVQNVSLTNDPQTVSFPVPQSTPRFWRVKVL